MYSIIGKLKLQTIENAKTLQMGWYGGLPYATSKDITEDDLMVIFLPDGQLSKEYAKEHDLVAYHDEAGKKRGGFFGKNRKVRPIKLMQGKIRSVGYVASIDTLAFTGYDVSKLKEGDSFDELNSVPICNKFINKQTQNAGNKVSHRREVRGLATHPDTKQFYKEVRNIKAGSLITITLKIDGTSCRVANAYGELNWFERHLSKLGLNVYKLQHLTGTRRVIIEQSNKKGYYGSHGMYLEVGQQLEGKLNPGEAVYGEVVGWIDEERPLFKRGGVIFKYGCQEGTRDFYVYNITQTAPNGQSINLSWGQIKARCDELGLKYVPELLLENHNNIYRNEDGWIRTLDKERYSDVIIEKHYYPFHNSFIYNGGLDRLERTIYGLVDGDDPIDPSHIREGVVIRVDYNGSTKFLKAKSEKFYSLEDDFKSSDNIDIEESA